jgi:hypothetical protein
MHDAHVRAVDACGAELSTYGRARARLARARRAAAAFVARLLAAHAARPSLAREAHGRAIRADHSLGSARVVRGSRLTGVGRVAAAGACRLAGSGIALAGILVACVVGRRAVSAADGGISSQIRDVVIAVVGEQAAARHRKRDDEVANTGSHQKLARIDRERGPIEKDDDGARGDAFAAPRDSHSNTPPAPSPSTLMPRVTFAAIVLE